MPRITDFRARPQFSIENVPKSGLSLGKTTYWKLYAIENFYRIIIHSILSVQIVKNWWPIATDVIIQNRAEDFRKKYIKKPWHGMPGQHLIYFITLHELNEIARVNSDLFIPVIPDIDQWIYKIEDLRLPRNVVAHMNFPNKIDRQRIDVIYKDFKALIEDIERKVTLQVPK